MNRGAEPQALEKASADVERMMKEFNIEPIETISNRLPPSELIELGILIAHRDFDKALNIYESGGRFAIVSGRGPSGPLHFGHILLFSIVRRLQELFDADVFIPLSDDEKFVFGKIKSLEEGKKWAYDNARYILALGFDPKKTHIYISSQTPWVYKYALMAARKLTISEVKGALGVSDSRNPGILFYAAVQIAHILQPTIDYGMLTVVPIGFDQDVYMRLSRDVAERLGIQKPASLYVRFFPGPLRVPMSASAPETAIFVTDDEETIRRKVMRAYTGGGASLEEHRRKGGKPDECVILEWLRFFIFKTRAELELFRENCSRGLLICGYDCKQIIAEHFIKLANILRKRAEKIDVERYLVRMSGGEA